MNVNTVVIINDFNYTQGGASKVAIDTARILKDSGINIIFFSAVNKKEDNIEGIDYISTNQNEALKEKNKLKGIINGIYNFKAKKILKKLLLTLDRKSTIIHIHGWTKALSCSIFDIVFKSKFKTILTLHDYFTACPNGGYFNYKKNEICNFKPLSWKCIKCNCDSRNYGFKLYRVLRQFVQNKIVKLNKNIRNVITISNFSEKILKETLNKNVNIKKIYNPIDIGEKKDIIDITKNSYFLYVGRVSQEKGVDLFCEVITDLKLKGIVVGDGEQLEILKEKYQNIQFEGWKSKEEVREYMNKARCLIFPSRWYETAGLTVLEAQSIGLPSIVSNKCATKEFIQNNVNGFIFNNKKELEQIIKKINQNEVLSKISKNAYEIYWKNPFDEKRYIKDIYMYYNNVLIKK